MGKHTDSRQRCSTVRVGIKRVSGYRCIGHHGPPVSYDAFVIECNVSRLAAIRMNQAVAQAVAHCCRPPSRLWRGIGAALECEKQTELRFAREIALGKNGGLELRVQELRNSSRPYAASTPRASNGNTCTDRRRHNQSSDVREGRGATA